VARPNPRAVGAPPRRAGHRWRWGWRAALATLVLAAWGAPVRGSLFISEYIEGDGENQAIELFNSGPAAVDLSTIGLSIYANGSATPTAVFGPGTIAATLSPGGVYTVAHQFWVDVGTINLRTLNLTYDGDDAVALYQNSESNLLDVVGQIGFDPGTRWAGGGVETKNAGMVRKSNIVKGDANGGDSFFPSAQWTAEAVTGIGLGSHNGTFTLIAADFDEDADVDGADLTTRWRNNFGLAAGALHTQGNADGDGDVDGADFLAWQRQVGTTSAAAVVAEPAAAGLASVALAWLVGRRRRRE
jgi:predicted extracellular nuclease